MRTILLGAILAMAVAAPGRSSIVIGQWSFSANPAPLTIQAPGLSNSDLTMTGLAYGGPGLFFSATDWSVGAYNPSQYFEWTVTPNPGYTVDYTSATLDYVMGTNPTFTFEVRSSLDSFTAAIASHILGPGINTYGDSLAALGIQTGAVTFRLYGQVDATAGQSGFYNGSMGINAADGAVYNPAPEPASLGLAAGLMSLGFVALKRSPACRRLLRSSR